MKLKNILISCALILKNFFQVVIVYVIGILFVVAVLWLVVNSIDYINNELKQTVYGKPARKCIEAIEPKVPFGYKADGFVVNYNKADNVVTFKALRQNQYGAWEKGLAKCAFHEGYEIKPGLHLYYATSHGIIYKNR